MENSHVQFVLFVVVTGKQRGRSYVVMFLQVSVKSLQRLCISMASCAHVFQ